MASLQLTGNLSFTEICNIVFGGTAGTAGRHLLGSGTTSAMASATGVFHPTHISKVNQLSRFYGYSDEPSLCGVFETEFIIISFNFVDGLDLDSRIRMISPVVGDYLGWSKASQYPSSNPFMRWGGDNTGTGQETVIIDVNAYKTAYPSNAEFVIDLRCFWYNVVGTSPVTTSAYLYKGGTMSGPVNYIYSVSDYTASKLLLSDSRYITLKTQNSLTEGTRVATLTYNTSTYDGCVAISTDLESPTAPTVTYANVTKTGFSMTLTGSTDNVAVTGYIIYQNGSEIKNIYLTNQTAITGLTADTTYTYTARAYDAAGNISTLSSAVNVTTLPNVDCTLTMVGTESYTPVDTTPPSTPYLASVVGDNNFQFIVVDWNASSDDVAVTGYTVWRALSSGGSYQSIGFTIAPNTQMLDDSASEGVIYYYKVTARDAANNVSGFSNIKSGSWSIACFIEGTLITTSSGEWVPIENLFVNQELLSSNISTFDGTVDEMSYIDSWTGTNIVLEENISLIQSITPFTVNETIRINGTLLEATPEHRQFIERKGVWMFVQFKDLQIGDYLIDNNKKKVLINRKEFSYEQRVVYQLKVSPNHLYYANNILTHNEKAPV